MSDFANMTPEESMNYAEDIAEKSHQYDMEMAQFNANESQKARDWSEYMSNTSYQRSVADLIKAGLNPVLASKLTGASTPSAASASGSSSAGSAMANVFDSLINSAVSAQNKLTDIAIASLNNQTSRDNNLLNASTSKQIAELQSKTQIYGYNKSYDASLYGSDTYAWIATLDNQTKRELSNDQINKDKEIAKDNIDLQKYLKTEDKEINIYNQNMDYLKQLSKERFEEYVKDKYNVNPFSSFRATQKESFEEFINNSYDEANSRSLIESLDNLTRNFKSWCNNNGVYIGRRFE